MKLNYRRIAFLTLFWMVSSKYFIHLANIFEVVVIISCIEWKSYSINCILDITKKKYKYGKNTERISLGGNKIVSYISVDIFLNFP